MLLARTEWPNEHLGYTVGASESATGGRKEIPPQASELLKGKHLPS